MRTLRPLAAALLLTACPVFPDPAEIDPQEGALTCETAADCEGFPHVACVGAWDCQEGQCAWECDTSVCQPCGEEVAPVCGSDGKTYPNACEAKCAGVTFTAGECHSAGDPSTENGSCAQVACRLYCEHGFAHDKNGCEICECARPVCDKCEGPARDGCTIDGCFVAADGSCQAHYLCPHDCSLIRYSCLNQPKVCGLDGKTYACALDAQCVGQTEVAHEGACEPPVDCTPAFYFCEDGPPVCGANGKTYACKYDAWCLGHTTIAHEGPCQTACGCPEEHAPVCGGDGRSYGNKCLALAAGVRIAHAGPCETFDCPWNGDSCPAGFRCTCDTPNSSTGFCGDFLGVCVADCFEPTCACPDLYAPVCGVNGQTYGNACEAKCAKVAVAHEGECRQPPEECCFETIGMQCVPSCGWDGGQIMNCYCSAQLCEKCGGLVCPDVWEPVCGADGRTYPNKCLAEHAGVKVAYLGECHPECLAGEHPAACCWEHMDPLSCEADRACAWLVPGCGDHPLPHEGCYPDPSLTCTTTAFPSCPGDSTCHTVSVHPCPDGKCNACSAQSAVCLPPPEPECACNYDLGPVCGGDGVTYTNRCQAACAGVEVAYEGECKSCHVAEGDHPAACCSSHADPESCAADRACGWLVPGYSEPALPKEGCYPDPAYCMLHVWPVDYCPAGSTCQTVVVDPCWNSDCDANGAVISVCLPAEEPTCVCTDEYAPVCGVDGVTYPNKCVAGCHHVAVAYPGACQAQVCSSDAECGDFQTCFCDDEPCLRPGPPTCIDCDCPKILAPVCGADGKTYPNACVAHCRGVTSYHEGACLSCACTQEYDPVCGADGRTYSNACTARCHGAGVRHWGECGAVCCGMCGVVNGGCPMGESCRPVRLSQEAGFECVPDGFCYTPQDCAGRDAPDCTGSWACERNACVFRCLQ